MNELELRLALNVPKDEIKENMVKILIDKYTLNDFIIPKTSVETSQRIIDENSLPLKIEAITLKEHLKVSYYSAYAKFYLLLVLYYALYDSLPQNYTTENLHTHIYVGLITSVFGVVLTVIAWKNDSKKWKIDQPFRIIKKEDVIS